MNLPHKVLQPCPRGQFHQHFTRSFFARRYQKRKKGSQVISHFVLWGYAVKALSIHAEDTTILRIK